MRKAIIVDLDGTVANTDHRLHHIQPPENFDPRLETFSPDWNAFNSACNLDDTHQKIVDLVAVMRDVGFAIIFVTGRDGGFRAKTINWMFSKRIDFDRIFMRPEGDRRSDVEIKKEIYDNYILGTYQVEFVLEDRSRVVQMWREIGLVCLQVKEGDY